MITLSPEIREFLLTGTRTAKLATIRADGRAHVVPVWIQLDGDEILFTIWHSTVKAQNMRRDPRVCLCVDDEEPPFGFVQIEGTSAFSDEPIELLRWATRIADRYMGADKAEAYGKRNSVPGELLVRIRPTKVVFQTAVSD